MLLLEFSKAVQFDFDPTSGIASCYLLNMKNLNSSYNQQIFNPIPGGHWIETLSGFFEAGGFNFVPYR